MSAPARATAIVVSFNTREDTLACLRSLRSAGAAPLDVIVADNDSRDGSAEAVRAAFPDVTLLPLGANLGFAAANNRALALVQTPYALLLNSDAQLGPGAAERLISYLDAHPRMAIAGPRTLNADGTPQISWGPDLAPLSEWRHRLFRRAVAAGHAAACDRLAALASREHAPDWLSGSCLLCRMESLRQVRFFDEGYFLYEEDADLCLRLRRAGWTLGFVPDAQVTHRSGRSMAGTPERAALAYHRSHLRYYALHNGLARTTLLRLWLLAHAAIGWLRSVGPGATASSARRRWRALATLALGPARGASAR